jgi:hypothetical protein
MSAEKSEGCGTLGGRFTYPRHLWALRLSITTMSPSFGVFAAPCESLRFKEDES